MADKETLHFKIMLGGTYWDKIPEYSVLINDVVTVAPTAIKMPTGEFEAVEFDFEVEEGPVVLKIRLENKTDLDTVLSDDKSRIDKDMLLNIKSIEIDEIELGNLKHTLSSFVGDDPARPTLKNCVDLGWNGAYTLPFVSPFYIWLLENI